MFSFTDWHKCACKFVFIILVGSAICKGTLIFHYVLYYPPPLPNIRWFLPDYRYNTKQHVVCKWCFQMKNRMQSIWEGLLSIWQSDAWDRYAVDNISATCGWLYASNWTQGSGKEAGGPVDLSLGRLMKVQVTYTGNTLMSIMPTSL